MYCRIDALSLVDGVASFALNGMVVTPSSGIIIKLLLHVSSNNKPHSSETFHGLFVL
jgi:hypothetical protein